MVQLGMITVDTENPRELASWWLERLNGEIVMDADGWFLVMKAPGLPVALGFQKVDDPTPGKNRQHLDLIRGEGEDRDALIAEWTATYDTDELLTTLHEAGIPAGLIYTAPDMLSDPHFAAREAIVSVASRTLGRDLSMQNVFPRLSATPGRVRHVGRERGEDNQSVYGGLLGMTPDEIAALADDGII